MLISEFMNADHSRLDSIFEEFQRQQSDDTAQAKALLDQFIAGLHTHIAWEEEWLFPIFEKTTGISDGGPTGVMRMEHEQIKKLLEEMNARVSRGLSQGLAELETGLLEVLGSHNHKEENILYPAIDSMVTDTDREKVLGDMADSSAAR